MWFFKKKVLRETPEQIYLRALREIAELSFHDRYLSRDIATIAIARGNGIVEKAYDSIIKDLDNL